jgi:hypothetical protein
MIKIKIDQKGRLIFPELNRDYFDFSSLPEFWLEEKEDAYILHQRLPNVRKIYLEPTTGCNLKCRTCIRQVWEDGEAQMSNSTFQKFLNCLPELPQLERIIYWFWRTSCASRNNRDDCGRPLSWLSCDHRLQWAFIE